MDGIWNLPVLRVIDGVVVIDWRFFFDDFWLCAWASHGWAEEYVDEQHDGEKDAEGDAEPRQPILISWTKTHGAVNRSG